MMLSSIVDDGLMQFGFCDAIVRENVIPDMPCMTVDCCKLVAVCWKRLPSARTYGSTYAPIIDITSIMIFFCRVFKQLLLLRGSKPFTIHQPFVFYGCDIRKLFDVFVHRSIIA